LENDILDLKSQIKNLLESTKKENSNENEKNTTNNYKLPDNLQSSLTLINQFNDIINNKLNFRNPEKIISDESSSKLDETINLIHKKENEFEKIEESILMGIEFLLNENKIHEALELIKWRKKILKLAEICGWTIANKISNRTIKKLGSIYNLPYFNI
jgi:pyruvate-formate lyase